MSDVDVLVVGGGICGASLAWRLAAERSVLVLERESQLGVHATGRSVATFIESLDGAAVRALTAGSRAFLESPPEGFGESPLRPMGLLYAAGAGQDEELARLAAQIRPVVPDAEPVDVDEAVRRVPYLRPEALAGGLFEPRAMEIDVNALHQGFVRGIGLRGGAVLRSRGLDTATYDGSSWRVVDTAGEAHRAEVVVDAAGAWGDEVAQRCGVRPVGLQPYRRTVSAFRPMVS